MHSHFYAVVGAAIYGASSPADAAREIYDLLEPRHYRRIVKKVGSVLSATDSSYDQRITRLPDQASRIFISGAARSGVVARFFAMRLRRFDLPAIGNLIELFDVRPPDAGYMDARIAACFPEMLPIIGFAAMATFRASAPPRRGDAYSSLDAQVERFAESSDPPLVVFQDLDQPTVAATFGEVTCTVYKSFGAVGLISSGAGRDQEQVRQLGFPVFTGGTICAHGYLHIPQLHVPVYVGGVAIYPNDLLHADCNRPTARTDRPPWTRRRPRPR